MENVHSFENLQRHLLGVGVIAFLIALGGFAIAFFGYLKLGWLVIAIAAIANIMSMITFGILKIVAWGNSKKS